MEAFPRRSTATSAEYTWWDSKQSSDYGEVVQIQTHTRESGSLPLSHCQWQRIDPASHESLRSSPWPSRLDTQSSKPSLPWLLSNEGQGNIPILHHLGTVTSIPVASPIQVLQKSGIKVSVRMLSWYNVPRKHSHTNFDSGFFPPLWECLHGPKDHGGILTLTLDNNLGSGLPGHSTWLPCLFFTPFIKLYMTEWVTKTLWNSTDSSLLERMDRAPVNLCHHFTLTTSKLKTCCLNIMRTYHFQKAVPWDSCNLATKYGVSGWTINSKKCMWYHLDFTRKNSFSLSSVRSLLNLYIAQLAECAYVFQPYGTLTLPTLMSRSTLQVLIFPQLPNTALPNSLLPLLWIVPPPLANLQWLQSFNGRLSCCEPWRGMSPFSAHLATMCKSWALGCTILFPVLSLCMCVEWIMNHVSPQWIVHYLYIPFTTVHIHWDANIKLQTNIAIGQTLALLKLDSIETQLFHISVLCTLRVYIVFSDDKNV